MKYKAKMKIDNYNWYLLCDSNNGNKVPMKLIN